MTGGSEKADREAAFVLQPVGRVSSRLVKREDAPRQADEGAPSAWLEFDPAFEDALHDLAVGEEILVAHSTEDVLRYVQEISDEECRAMGESARARALRDHTASARARTLVGYVEGARRSAVTGVHQSMVGERTGT